MRADLRSRRRQADIHFLFCQIILIYFGLFPAFQFFSLFIFIIIAPYIIYIFKKK
jgi:hypothetical protein